MSVAAFEGISKAPHTPGANGAPIAAVVPANARRTAPPSRSAAPHPDASRALVLSVIKRIEGYLEEETAALQKSLDFDFKASNDRKAKVSSISIKRSGGCRNRTSMQISRHGLRRSAKSLPAILELFGCIWMPSKKSLPFFRTRYRTPNPTARIRATSAPTGALRDPDDHL